ncbi:hypothetical protein [Cytobacillus sp. IB215665]|uniref:hypothetical protein n=1 Tax=Cytobacillus sp. IB215665 TaxID=3097357 RepID=UPI002A1802B9|nr:hypothetical protein [Cytobacillus sp. IB215665]MDX8367814.1 hypothetical protein [Cytobacillus sp. IB215665]
MKKDDLNQALYSVYKEELDDLSYSPTGVLDKIMFKITRKFNEYTDLKYTFTVPLSEYLRGKLFCDDVSDAMEKRFTQINLISILLDDFLYQAKRRSNPYDLYRELDSRFRKTIEVHNYKDGNKTFYINPRDQKMKSVDCIIKRKDALRLEVMLSDIADIQQEKSFTVSEVLQILYRDFIFNYKNGSLTNVMENVIKRLSQ